jgi:hypothetical protein
MDIGFTTTFWAGDGAGGHIIQFKMDGCIYGIYSDRMASQKRAKVWWVKLQKCENEQGTGRG